MVDGSFRAGELKRALRREGIRITRQRLALLKVLGAAKDHPDANEIYRRTAALDATVSLSTVYRTLTVLEQLGVIHRLLFDGAPARFEASGAPHHDHMIDVDTGNVVEFRSEKIERLQAKIAAKLGYELVHHKLELYGRKCAKKKKHKG